MIKAPVEFVAKETTKLVTDVLDIGTIASEFIPDPVLEAAFLGAELLDLSLGAVA